MMLTQTQIYDVVTQDIIFQKYDNSLSNASNLELLSAFLVGHFGGGGVDIKLISMFSNTNGGSFGIDFPFILKTEKAGGKCFTQTTAF